MLVNLEDVADLRMRNVRLWGAPAKSPQDVVRWLGAVQSQEFGPAKWSIAQRLARPTSDAAIDELFNNGTVLRTHVLRPTWHFVLPEDIVWMLELTGPRVRQKQASRDRQLGIDVPVMKKSNTLITRALRGGGRMTRQELRAALAKGGVDVADSQRLNHIVGNAELMGVICSGELRGKQHTYALIEDRARNARSLSPDDALAELTRRYFTSHGPATVKDFSWWSSLTTSEIRRGIGMLGAALRQQTIDGLTYWSARTAVRARATPPRAHFLQPYDEIIVGYTESRYSLDLSGMARTHFPEMFSAPFLVDGQVLGSYKRALEKNTVRIAATPFRPLDRTEAAALDEEAERLGSFLGLGVDLTTTTARRPRHSRAARPRRARTPRRVVRPSRPHR